MRQHKTPNAPLQSDSEFLMEIHPVADIFPMITEDEFQRLKTDIEQNGQRKPIVVHMGRIINSTTIIEPVVNSRIVPKYKEWTPLDDIFAAGLAFKRFFKILIAW